MEPWLLILYFWDLSSTTSSKYKKNKIWKEMYGWYAKKGNIKVKVDIESLIQPYIHLLI